MEGQNPIIINESNATNEEVKSSPEQAAISDETDTTTAGARSYECVFCKRGFSTAQALGGHMNIHRRDRIRVAKSSSSTLAAASSASSKRPDCNVSGYYHPYSLHKVRPSTSSSFSPPIASSDNIPKCSYRPPSSFIKGDHHRSSREPGVFDHDQELQLGLGLMHGDDLGKRVEGGEEKGDGEEKLDLELRLGHDPL